MDNCVAQEEESTQTSIEQNNIYECDVEGCNAAFIKFGNYLNHAVINNHPRIVEKFR